ncbi:hypothetical protein [Streptomyces sp. 11x1]|uniref:hypothetical protein n=1 Tax=Streptomyces sp. 11x1 TaxID=3038642 RepID=UPI00293079B8|nr:hypothetical protein [Streptomyces sp. 11x1]WNZ06169.1 hypothetical protein P8T65_00205 [Streptomyces sp. 11x1]
MDAEVLMSDRWRLRLGDKQILSGKNEFPSRLMTVFQEEDKYMQKEWVRAIDELNRNPADQELSARLETIGAADDDDSGGFERFGYRTTVETVLARLRLMGFTPEASVRSMAEIRRSELREYGMDENILLVSPAHGVQGTPHEMSCVQVILTGLAAYIKGCTARHELDFKGEEDEEEKGEDLDLVELNCIEELEFYFEDGTDDPRFILSALLHGQDPQAIMTMDLSELLATDYISSTEDLSAQANRELSFITASTGPIIVITEGRFDSHVLPRALRLVRPEIANYFKFWDLDTSKAAGGTDQVVKNMRSFAAAGVMNRVIGILDNDTAGRQAEKQLVSTLLPGHYAVCRLPDLDYARSYPTLGPSGTGLDDVTGRACSVEFYFGRECLLGTDGELIPVRWKSHINSMDDYQGELSEKAYVQRRIEAMLAEAEAHREPLGSEWDPMRQLAQMLVDLAEPPAD